MKKNINMKINLKLSFLSPQEFVYSPGKSNNLEKKQNIEVKEFIFALIHNSANTAIFMTIIYVYLLFIIYYPLHHKVFLPCFILNK